MEMRFKPLAINEEIMGFGNPFRNFSREKLMDCWEEYRFACANGAVPSNGLLEEMLKAEPEGTGSIKLVNLSIQLVAVMACRYAEDC